MSQPAASGPLLAVRALAKSYATQAETLPVLTGLDFDLSPGESLSVIGESGTGKSTLLNLLGGLDYASGGTVTLFGTELGALDETGLARFRNERLGFVFQYHHLLPDFTALENAMLPALIAGRPREEAQAAAGELLSAIGLAGRAHHKPAQLSGGEQQRVAVARALVNRPGLVLMDEPTGNLDERTSAAVLDLVWNLRRDAHVATVIVTHNLSIARRADRCLRLSGGGGAFVKP